MARKFMLNYESGVYDAYFGREEFFILINYAIELNPSLGEKLYFAGETEYIYRSEHNIPLDGLEYDESDTTHWDIASLTQVANFITDELIPSLESETINNIVDILGGWDHLKLNINQGPAYKKRFGLVSSQDKIFVELYNYTYFLNSFRNVIDNAIAVNEPYIINYSE